MWKQFRAFVSGMLIAAMALSTSPVWGMQFQDPPMRQAPPATPSEWQDAVTVIGAGLESESAIGWQFEEMRQYGIWLYYVWECAFGRALSPEDRYPVIQQSGLLADGVYDLHAMTGETASIELVRTDHLTRSQILDLLDPGVEFGSGCPRFWGGVWTDHG